MAGIELAHVSKVFAGDVTAVDDVTLSIADGEFLVLVGPSGCGKSTLLRMVAGLEEVTDGRVSIGDAKLRVGMRASLAQLHAQLGVTTVYVTHDQTEAMTLGQRVAVMRDGRVLQVDEPQRLYREPHDLFVAAFIGSPAMNLVEATIADGEIAFGRFRVPLERPPRSSGRIVLGIRPESFEDVAFASPELPTLDVRVEVLEELGADAHVMFTVDAPRITAETLEAGEDEALVAGAETLFTARVDPRTAARPKEPLRLAVDPARFHFFDPATGAALARDTASAAVPELVA